MIGGCNSNIPSSAYALWAAWCRLPPSFKSPPLPCRSGATAATKFAVEHCRARSPGLPTLLLVVHPRSGPDSRPASQAMGAMGGPWGAQHAVPCSRRPTVAKSRAPSPLNPNPAWPRFSFHPTLCSSTPARVFRHGQDRCSLFC